MNNGRKGASQAISIGLAPENNAQDLASAQKRIRAESRFTFKPDEQSESQDLSQGDAFENEEDELEESLMGDPETAEQFFSKEYRQLLQKEFEECRPAVLRQAVNQRWNELTLKQKSPFELLAHQVKTNNNEKLRQANQKSATRRGAKLLPKGPP